MKYNNKIIFIFWFSYVTVECTLWQRRFPSSVFCGEWEQHKQLDTTGAMHLSYVPNKSTLACQGQLQGLLEGQDHGE